MRVGAGVLAVAILICAFAYGIHVLGSWLRLPDQVPVLYYVALAVFLVVAFLLICKVALPARPAGEEQPTAAAREKTWRLCAVGIVGWLLVLAQFSSLVETGWLRLLWIFVPMSPYGILVPFFLLFSVGIGILALGKAKSRRAKWIVALADLSPPIGYAAAAWWLTRAGYWRF